MYLSSETNCVVYAIVINLGQMSKALPKISVN